MATRERIPTRIRNEDVRESFAGSVILNDDAVVLCLARRVDPPRQLRWSGYRELQ
ncbi:hypothetical protein AKJ09_10495 [Labilithrix luteola]|uniref:Uncharacterized protein n=1 Tax=Labilithrix luteola TaxID=1391654 RepID=A0A0K1QDV3_9BACT|nr:hypothetical protein AKJ09_10495 [Labilithrix luteola]